MSEEEIEWIKLPHDMQHRFFEHAEDESRKIFELVPKFSDEINSVKEIVSSSIKEFKKSNSKYTVAAVDSSRSPTLSERLGVRYGVFGVGITYLTGNERKEEFGAGVFKRKQALSQDESKYMFDIISVYNERKFAEKALNNADFVIIDGAFYGFLYTALKMKQQGFYDQYHQDVVKKAFEITSKLIDSKKVIGVVKRSHTKAIGGYLALKNKQSVLTSIIDKLILSLIMPTMSYFRYEDLIGAELPSVYSHIAALVNRGKASSPEVLMQDAITKIYRPVRELGFEEGYFKSLRRLQIRAYKDVPPCEIEYPADIDFEKMLSMFGQENFFNEATNLPLVLDLIDSSVSITSKFAFEFTNEVEARVLQLFEKSAKDREAARVFFTLLNPQKPY